MTRTSLYFLLLSIILLLAQGIVFSHVCLFGVAVPFVFIFVPITLPLTLNRNWVITIGFIMGMIVDIFCDTPGVNALAATLMSASRSSILRLYFPHEQDLTDPCPSIKSLGLSVFLRYLVTITLLYSMIAMIADSLTFFNILHIVSGIAGSTILSSALLLALDYLTSTQRREKRL
ncbi:MAG: rod shape-determining protein MreD [Paramuribaculum sp.]|nr:rod shape-determining protein MreD [Paramuribaculum sp.]MDE6303516.1 rod shape-determining protein MreD [Paramuribaculum sp.]